MEGVAIDTLPSGSGAGSSSPQKLSLAGEQIVRIVEAQESERQRLANSLHDGPAQSLSNFMLQAEIVQRLFDRDPDKATVELGNLRGSALTSFNKIREFIFELRPMMLDDLGLIATMRRHSENFNEKHTDVKLTFHLIGSERRFPAHVEVIMFRAYQLLIGNALDLANATEISAKLEVHDNEIRGTVEDNGKGFDPQVVLDRSKGDSPRQNLLDLRERVQLVNGRLDIHSGTEADQHTIIEVILPFSG
jgi:two-component system sensor histidine kinase DegS